MDTTLRDGEQTSGVSFTASEKIQTISFMLEKLGVDRMEIASARVSPAKSEVFQNIHAWAIRTAMLPRLEVLGFVDHGRSVEWVVEANFLNINFLTKGSQRHCELQLKKTRRQHLQDIEENVKLAKDHGLIINAYLEDWSNGCLYSPEYVKNQIEALVELQLNRIYLPDTLGIFSPEETYRELSEICNRYPNQKFEFHGHNDYGLAVANCLAAVKAGVTGLHVTVNGLGERAGNAPLEAVVCALHDKTAYRTNIYENHIHTASILIENYSGKKNQANRPIVGQDVFTQTAGVHADGDKKGQLYVSALHPNRFGRTHIYALGKQSGLASIERNLQDLGIELDQEKTKVLLARVKSLGEKKQSVTIDDLPLLIRDIFDTQDNRVFVIRDVELKIYLRRQPTACVKILIDKKSYRGEANGDGGYDAFMHALQKILTKKKIKMPELIDYEIHIPPGGKTDALVKCSILWQVEPGKTLRTVGISTDQVVAAIFATEKMLNRLNAIVPFS